MNVYNYECEICLRTKVAHNFSSEMRLGKKKKICKSCVKIMTHPHNVKCVKCGKVKSSEKFKVAALVKRESPVCDYCRKKLTRPTPIVKKEVKFEKPKGVCYKQEILDRMDEIRKDIRITEMDIMLEKRRSKRRDLEVRLRSLNGSINAANALYKYL